MLEEGAFRIAARTLLILGSINFTVQKEEHKTHRFNLNMPRGTMMLFARKRFFFSHHLTHAYTLHIAALGLNPKHMAPA